MPSLHEWQTDVEERQSHAGSSHEGEGDFLEDALTEIFEELRAKRAAEIKKILENGGKPPKKK
ncbi:hypothetical protein BAE36_20670 [Rhizobium leguminosarum bv. trifolii]|jgi:hypothetical protein|nr:hypothetical protein BAE36_20670 [Rhizobium leguminosarum bv. trifolii]